MLAMMRDQGYVRVRYAERMQKARYRDPKRNSIIEMFRLLPRSRSGIRLKQS